VDAHQRGGPAGPGGPVMPLFPCGPGGPGGPGGPKITPGGAGMGVTDVGGAGDGGAFVVAAFVVAGAGRGDADVEGAGVVAVALMNSTSSIAASPFQLEPRVPTKAMVGAVATYGLRSTLAVCHESPWSPDFDHTSAPFTLTASEPMELPYM